MTAWCMTGICLLTMILSFAIYQVRLYQILLWDTWKGKYVHLSRNMLLGYSQQMTAAEPFLFHLLSNKCNNYKKPFCTCRQWIDVQIHKRKHHSKLNLYPVKCTHVDLPASFLNIEKDTSDNASAHKWGETKREAKSKKEAEGWRWTKYETSIGGYLITTWLG